MEERQACPECGQEHRRNPFPTVDIIIFTPGRGVILVERKNPPHGWALPGGFVDYGETVEQAAVREAKEETGLEVELIHLLGVYSDPARDPRKHTMSVVYVALTPDIDQARHGDDAADLNIFPLEKWPDTLAFDHAEILKDFSHWLNKNKPGG